MPTALGNLITDMATVSVAFMQNVIQSYWPYILGIVVLVGLGLRFKRMVGLAR